MAKQHLSAAPPTPVRSLHPSPHQPPSPSAIKATSPSQLQTPLCATERYLRSAE